MYGADISADYLSGVQVPLLGNGLSSLLSRLGTSKSNYFLELGALSNYPMQMGDGTVSSKTTGTSGMLLSVILH